MRLVATISDNLQPLLDDQAEAISIALRTAIETASTSLLDELRGQVRAAGLGTGLEKAWRREVYPRTRMRTCYQMPSRCSEPFQTNCAPTRRLRSRGSWTTSHVPQPKILRLARKSSTAPSSPSCVMFGRRSEQRSLQPWPKLLHPSRQLRDGASLVRSRQSVDS